VRLTNAWLQYGKDVITSAPAERRRWKQAAGWPGRGEEDIDPAKTVISASRLA
jgi:hypothetical protein